MFLFIWFLFPYHKYTITTNCEQVWWRCNIDCHLVGSVCHIIFSGGLCGEEEFILLKQRWRVYQVSWTQILSSEAVWSRTILLTWWGLLSISAAAEPLNWQGMSEERRPFFLLGFQGPCLGFHLERRWGFWRVLEGGQGAFRIEKKGKNHASHVHWFTTFCLCYSMHFFIDFY